MAYQQSNYPFKKVEWPKRKKKNQYKGKSKSGIRGKNRNKLTMKPETVGLMTVLGGLATAVGLTSYRGGIDTRTEGVWKDPKK